jgi:serine/threonine protein kinase
MGSIELDHIRTSLDNAHSPEEIFGTLVGTRAERIDAARKVFRQIAKTAHPDLYQGTVDFDRANAIFKKLAHLWELAQARIENGTYGTTQETNTFTPFSIRTPKCQYHIEKFLTQGDLCNLYLGISSRMDKQKRYLLKFPVKPEDNDLVLNEARILAHLKKGTEYEKLHHFVSQLVDSFSYQERTSGIIRQVNVLSYQKGWYSLKEVREAYPHGIDARDVAWIWRRLLVALGLAHANHVIHGAVLPTHVLISPDQHGVMLIDWSYAVLQPATTGEYISAISSTYREWYPEEVFAKEEPTPGLDISMAALCMVYLLNGNPHKRTLPGALPWQLQNYLKGCMLPRPQQRPQEVSILLDDFDALIERLWGPRRFHQFVMPER